MSVKNGGWFISKNAISIDEKSEHLKPFSIRVGVKCKVLILKRTVN